MIINKLYKVDLTDPEIEDEIIAFESYYALKFPAELFVDKIRPNNQPSYKDDRVNALWTAWIARASIRSPNLNPVINIKCEHVDGKVTSTMSLDVVRVEIEDDGAYTAVTNHWPVEQKAILQYPPGVRGLHESLQPKTMRIEEI